MHSSAYARVYDATSNDRFGIWGPGGLNIADTAAHRIIQGPALFGYLSILLATLTGSTLAGAWLIEGSNDYAEGGGGGTPRAGTWQDVTACFREPNATTGTAIAAVVSGASAQHVVFTTGSGVVVPFPFASIRVTFTAASGSGNAVTCFNAQPVGA